MFSDNQWLSLTPQAWYSFAREEYNRWLVIDGVIQGPDDDYALTTIGDHLPEGLRGVRFINIVNPWEEELPGEEWDDVLQQMVSETFSECLELEEIWYELNEGIPIGASVRVDIYTSRVLSFLTRFRSMFIVSNPSDCETNIYYLWCSYNFIHSNYHLFRVHSPVNVTS